MIVRRKGDEYICIDNSEIHGGLYITQNKIYSLFHDVYDSYNTVSVMADNGLTSSFDVHTFDKYFKSIDNEYTKLKGNTYKCKSTEGMMGGLSITVNNVYTIDIIKGTSIAVKADNGSTSWFSYDNFIKFFTPTNIFDETQVE